MDSSAASAAGPLIFGISLALWVAIAVAIISLTTNWQSNRNARKNLKRQLKHDAKQRDRDRIMALRRDVYLPAASALVHLNSVVARLSNMDYDQKLLSEEMALDQAILAKVHVVGREETVEAVMGYMNAIGPAFLELIGRRLPLLIRKRDIADVEAVIENMKVDRQRCIAIMQQYLIEAKPNDAKWNAVNHQYDFAGKELDKYVVRRAELSAEQMRDQFALSQRVIDLAENFSKLLPIAVLAVRREMENPLDPILYEKLFELQITKARETWEKSMAHLQMTVVGSTQQPAPPDIQ